MVYGVLRLSIAAVVSDLQELGGVKLDRSSCSAPRRCIIVGASAVTVSGELCVRPDPVGRGGLGLWASKSLACLCTMAGREAGSTDEVEGSDTLFRRAGRGMLPLAYGIGGARMGSHLPSAYCSRKSGQLKGSGAWPSRSAGGAPAEVSGDMVGGGGSNAGCAELSSLETTGSSTVSSSSGEDVSSVNRALEAATSSSDAGGDGV